MEVHSMTSVTQRIKQITQPRGGYLKPSEFEKEEFIDNEILKEENMFLISSSRCANTYI